jgi:hypothetical protein
MAISVSPLVGGGIASADEHTLDPHAEGAFCDGAPTTNDFPDVTDADPGNLAISCLTADELNIVKGFVDGTYRPNDPTARRQMALFIQRLADTAKELEAPGEDLPALPPYDGTNEFPDTVNETPDHIQAINRLNDADPEIVRGFPDGTYRPAMNVTRRQMALFILRTYAFLTETEIPTYEGEDNFPDISDEEAEQRNAINLVSEMGIFQGNADGTFGPGQNITRRQMAFVITRFLELLYQEGLIVSPFAVTNQTIAVTPAGDATMPNTGSRDYSVDLTGLGTVVVTLAECDNVTITNGIVTFDRDADGNADFGTVSATISDVERDSVAFPGGSSTTVTGDGGTLTFTVDGAGTDECVIPVVYAPDSDGDLPTDADGAPTNDFGIGGAVHFVDVDALTVSPASALNPFGTEHTVTATLVDASLPQAQPVPVDGQTLQYQIVRGIDPCPAFGAAPVSNLVATGTVSTTDGSATITYTGPADPNPATDGDELFDCIIVQWTGSGAFAGEGPETATAEKTWTDADVEAAELVLSPFTSGSAAGVGNHTVTATVTDQFGDPVEGATVVFSLERWGYPGYTPYTDLGDHTRTTNSAGVATFTYAGPATAAWDYIYAEVYEDAVATGVSDDGWRVWTVPAATGEYHAYVAAGGGGVLHADAHNQTAGEFQGVSFAYGANDQYFINGAAATPGAFETALQSQLALLETERWNMYGVEIEISYNTNPAVPSQFDLITFP